MAVSVRAQVGALLAALALGVLLGLLYDTVRILRILCGMPHAGGVHRRLLALRFPLLAPDFATRRPGRAGARAHAVLLFVTDFLYALAAGILFILFVYWQNDGVFRFYYLVCAAVGLFAYYQSAGRLVMAFAGSIVFFLRVLAAYLVLFIKAPLLFLWRQITRGSVWLFLALYTPLYARRAARLRMRSAARAFLPETDLLS